MGLLKSVAMNIRHAAALTLVGWHLMVPPLKYDRAGHPITDLRGNEMADWTASLSDYWNVESFDSAQECKDAQTPFISSHEGAWSPSQRLASVCIASDDPRLKEK